MKKIFLFLFIVVATCVTANAQLSKTKWTGTLMLEQPAEVTLDFTKDTLTAITNADGNVLETMTFTVKDHVLSISKVAGQSDCGEVAGKYKISIKGDSMEFTLVEDACFNRAGVLDKTKWTKKK